MIPDTLEPAPTPQPETRNLEPETARKPGRPPIFDAVKQHTFLRLVSVGFSTRRAARLVGVSPSTVREKARTSPPFACGYEDAKAQAIPALAENVYHAGKRSWRASAWLLERLRPSQFGHRVALGPDPAKRREAERLRQEKKKEQLDLQRPELNDQILIRCIRRLFTDGRALDIFEACANDFDREAREKAKADSEEPQSPMNPVDDSDSARNHQPTQPVDAPETLPVDHLPTPGDLSAPDQSGPEQNEHAKYGGLPSPSPDVPLGNDAYSSPALPLFASAVASHHDVANYCAPPPSAKNSTPSATDPITEAQAPQPQPPIAPLQAAPNFCALTPPAPYAEMQRACEVTGAHAPSRPPPLSDLAAQQCAMILFG